jgi:O-antigen biosynthesis protein
MSISIIVPTVGEGGQYLKNLLPVLRHEPDCEIIVVDNLSTDFTAEVCRVNKVKHILNEVSVPFAAACNIGAYHSSGEYLLFLNNDTVPEAGFLQKFYTTYNRPDLQVNGPVGIVGPKLVFLHNPALIQCAAHAFYPTGMAYEYGAKQPVEAPEFNQLMQVNSVMGAALFVSRKLYEEAGGFFEGYRNGWEDVDFCLQIREKGYKVIYDPSIVIRHVHRGSDNWGEGRIATDPFNVFTYKRRWIQTQRIFKVIGKPDGGENNGREVKEV